MNRRKRLVALLVTILCFAATVLLFCWIMALSSAQFYWKDWDLIRPDYEQARLERYLVIVAAVLVEALGGLSSAIAFRSENVFRGAPALISAFFLFAAVPSLFAAVVHPDPDTKITISVNGESRKPSKSYRATGDRTMLLVHTSARGNEKYAMLSPGPGHLPDTFTGMVTRCERFLATPFFGIMFGCWADSEQRKQWAPQFGPDFIEFTADDGSRIRVNRRDPYP